MLYFILNYVFRPHDFILKINPSSQIEPKNTSILEYLKTIDFKKDIKATYVSIFRLATGLEN